MNEDSNPQRKRGIQSIEIGMRILEALAQCDGASPLSALAQLTGIPAPQVHRYLQSLIDSGMARQDPASGRYDLGPAALRFGLAALARTDLFKLVDRVIGEFVERTGQTMQIAALGPAGPTIVRIYNGRPALLTTLHVGAMLPLSNSATGRVFLAFAPASETAALVERERRENGLSADALDAIVAQVQERSMAEETGSVIPGLHAAAFPIFDLQGRAVLVATALMAEASAGERRTAVRELGELCHRMSAELGWRGSPTPEISLARELPHI